jgi:SAV_6107-like HEPN
MIGTLKAIDAQAPARSAAGPRGAAGPRDSVLPGTEALGSGALGCGPLGTGVAGPRRRLPATVLSLLEQARQGLAEARAEADPGTRYICAHLAALRAAAAIVGARVEPGAGSRRRRPRSVWELLPQAEPALSEWAAFFAASAAKRAAAEAGLPRAATAREAEELIRDAETFLRVAERALGVDGQPQLPLRPAS